MKFSSYNQQIAPNVIGTQGYRTTNDAAAFGVTKGQDAMVGALGQVNKVLSKEQDDMDAMKLNEARNSILSSLNESLYGENGLFTTGVGENAFGLTNRTSDLIKKTFSDVGKNYNPRVRYALKLNMKDNVDNYQRIAASKEQGEIEKYKTGLENASIDQSRQDMADNFADDKIVEDSLYNSVRQLAARGKRLGWSGLEFQQQSRDMVSNLLASAIDSALQTDEVDRAGQLLENYGNMMNMDSYTKIANYVKRRTAIRDEKKFAEKLLEDCKNPDGSYNLSMYQEKLKKFQEGRLPAPAAYAYGNGTNTAVNPQGNGNAGGATTKTIDASKLFNAEGKADTRYVDTGRELDSTVQEMAQKYNVPTPLVHAVIDQESGYDGGAVSSAGAQGLMQLMPGTAKEMGVTDPFDYRQNIEGGVKYLRNCLDATNGDIHQALARYNGGPGYMNTGEAQRYADQVEARIKKMNGTNPLPEAKEAPKTEEKPQEKSQQKEDAVKAESAQENNQSQIVQPAQQIPEVGSTVRAEQPNLSRSNLSARARGIRGVNPGADPELLERLTGYANQIANKQTEDNKERAEALAIQADRAYSDRASALAFIESHKGEFTMAGFNYLKSLIDSNEKFAPPRPVRSGGGGGGGGRYRNGGGSSSRNRRTGMYDKDGEYHSKAEIERAWKWYGKYQKKSAYGNKEDISEYEQEQMNKSTALLVKLGFAEGTADVEAQRQSYAEQMDIAIKVWDDVVASGSDSPWADTVNILKDTYGWGDTQANTILGSMPDKEDR